MSASVVGIDFGCQNSVIAAAGRGGVDVILNGNSNRQNPSMVGFGDARKMGEAAGGGAVSNFKNTVSAMKRLIGLSFDDPRAQRQMKYLASNFQPIVHSNGFQSIGVEVQVAGESKVVAIEAVAGTMIKHMGEIAARKAQQTAEGVNSLEKLFPQDWVIGIPSYYTDAQRRALLTGCEIVGITSGIQRLMHESTATALAYGIFKDLKKEFTKDDPTNVMFIDMGASAYTVSIAAFEPGKLTVKSSFSDPDLGGRDFDWAIAEWISAQFENKYSGKLSGKPMERPKTRLKILAAAEKAKKTLSPQGVKAAQINLEMLMDDFDFNCKLTSEDYEAMSVPLLERLAAPIEAALKEAGLTADKLASVEIVGGSTRIGCLKRRLQEILGTQLSTTLNADECVARGCALQSAILSPRFKVLPYDIKECQNYPIKVKWDDNSAEGMEVDAEGNQEATDSVVMFDRGLDFPVVRRVTLKRAGAFEVKVAYDDASVNFGLASDLPKDIASFVIKATEGDIKKVRVNVKQDIHGIISMSSAQMVEEIVEEAAEGEETAKEGEVPVEGDEAKKKTKVKKTNLEFEVSRPYEWSQTDVNKANEDEVAMANNDRIVKETADMRNELESYIYDMRDKIEMDSQLGAYASAEEKSAFLEKNQAIENWLYEDGFDATKSVYAEKLAELKKLGSPVEQRQIESQERAAAVSTLQATLEQFKNWANESAADEKYKHITDEERQKVQGKCDEVSAWMYEMLDKQGALAQNQDPVLTVFDLNAKNRETKETCGPIVHKPPPKKVDIPPAPASSPAPAPTDEAKKEEASGEATPMDVDGDKPEETNGEASPEEAMQTD